MLVFPPGLQAKEGSDDAETQQTSLVSRPLRPM
jgi:hypothetical protein